MSVRSLVFLISLVSFGNFNPALFGMPDAAAEAAQKMVGLGLWLLVIAATFLPGVQRRPSPTTGLLLPTAFLCWAALSVLWSGQPASSAEKVLVLAFTTFGAWRLSTAMRCDELFDVLAWSLLALALASIALALLVPSIGVLRTWQHAGQWSGLFVSKQTLGTVGALLVFLGLLRLCRGANPLGAAGLAAGVAAVFGSGSRGGAAMAALAVACVLFSRRSARLAALMSALPLAIAAVAAAGIVFLVATGLPYFPIGGEKVDLTDRTLIWHFALEAWTSRPLLGFGLQGFWTDPDYYDHFARKHGWVLDNYHSGYVLILVELGLFGAFLFAAYLVVLCRKLGRLMSGVGAMAAPDRFGAEAAFGFLILYFLINFTETFFLRATDFGQVVVAFATIAIFAQQPVRAATGPRAVGRGPAWPAA